MLYSLDGISVFFICCNNHLWIVIFDLQKIPKFTFYCLFTVEYQCNLNIYLFIISCGNEICLMILLPTGLYIKTSEEQLVVNNILKNFRFITGLIANNGIPDT